MGTRGFKVVRYRGKYYVKYSYCDSYPTALGNRIVQTIPTKAIEYEAWFSEYVKYFAGEEESIADDWDAWKEKRPQGITSEPKNSTCADSYWREPGPVVPYDGVFIEYAYIIDLDRRVFTVYSLHLDRCFHFALDNIPRGRNGKLWIQYVEPHDELDSSGHAPSLDPDPSEVLMDALVYPCPLTDKRRVRRYEKIATPCPTALALPPPDEVDVRDVLATGLFRRFCAQISCEDIPSYAPFDPWFQGAAFTCLLYATTGLCYFDSVCCVMTPKMECMDAFPPTPPGTLYTYYGHAVLLETHLDHADNLKAAVVALVESAEFQATRRGLLISLSHLVVVRATHSGRAEHSAPLALMSGAVKRGADLWSANMDDVPGFCHVLAQLRAFFPARRAALRLPEEVYAIILEYACADRRTYRACRRACVLFRALCSAQPKIFESWYHYTVVGRPVGSEYATRVRVREPGGPEEEVLLLFRERTADVGAEDAVVLDRIVKRLKERQSGAPFHWCTRYYPPWNLDHCMMYVQ